MKEAQVCIDVGFEIISKLKEDKEFMEEARKDPEMMKLLGEAEKK